MDVEAFPDGPWSRRSGCCLVTGPHPQGDCVEIHWFVARPWKCVYEDPVLESKVPAESEAVFAFGLF